MAEPTVQQIFGTDASQNIDELIVQKLALTGVGLVANANNTAESLFVSMILRAGETLTEENRLLNPEQNIVVGEKEETITTVFENNVNKRYKIIVIPIELYIEQEEITVNPMLY